MERELPELRKDYLIDRWVSIAPERARRPIQRVTEGTAGDRGECPFCPGREDKTPPATLVYKLRDGELIKLRDEEKRVRGWIVRCFPNLYPAFTHSSDGKSSVKIPAKGFHEVLVETPNHEDRPWTIDLVQQSLALMAMVERVREMYSKGATHVSAFKNHGVTAGASMSHSHMQIIGLPMKPKLLIEEEEGFKDKDCPYCLVVEREAGGERFVTETERFMAVTPWASRSPFELLILPKTHERHFLNLKLDELRDLASILSKVFRAIRGVLGEVDFNMWFHHSFDSRFHWHVELLPKTSIWAGLELGFEVYVNPTPPEKAAEELRLALGEGINPLRI